MKKLFTLLLAIGTVSAVFAQDHSRSDQNRGYNENWRTGGIYRSSQPNVSHQSNRYFDRRTVIVQPSHRQQRGQYNVPQKRKTVVIVGSTRSRGNNAHGRW